MADETKTPDQSPEDIALLTPFNREKSREKFNGFARAYVEGNGFQAVVIEYEEGVTEEVEIEVFRGSRRHAEEWEAKTSANKWIGAELDRAAKVHELKRRRQKSLTGVTNLLVEEIDDLDARQKALGVKKKDKKDELRLVIKEAKDPEVRIEFSEGTGGHKLVIIKGGKEVTIDTRQQTLDLPDGETADAETGEVNSGPEDMMPPDDESPWPGPGE